MKFKYLIISFLLLFVTACSEKKDKNENIKNEPNKVVNLVIDNNKTIKIQDKNENFKILDSDNPSVFIFYTTTCQACKEELRVLNKLNLKYKINMIAINASSNDNNLSQNLKNITFANENSSKILLERMDKIKQIPYIIIFDKNGVINKTFIGLFPSEMLDYEIKKVVS